MADMIANGMTWLRGQQRVATSESVTYRRGDVVAAPIVAMRGRTQLQVGGGDEIKTTADIFDWIIDVSDLVLDGIPVEPRVGDEIIANGQVYQCQRLFDQDHFRYTDQFKIAYRIHTVNVGAL